MSENLLCPFCGIGKPKTGFTRAYIRAKEEGRDHECKRVATVYCDSCPVQFIECYESEEAALKAWNTRAITPSPELVELRKEVAAANKGAQTNALINKSLIQQLGELRKDKERLDWLEETGTGVNYNVEVQAWGLDFESPWKESIRTAIDAAKEKK